ncbi:hypothetical protein [Senegalia sp. (in: firmicutes)]|uniref:hypothetical protein n=1 Tax=Senegalia sp. (in: firmicutes) TaxID=1924098 RepID=UPI003F9A4129
MIKEMKAIIGTLFILISTILYSAKYISAAMLSINSGYWAKDEFKKVLSYTPTSLNISIYISFAIGIILIIWYILGFLKKQIK